MKFRSVDDLNRDLATWSESLPDDIDLVVGVPRSGMLAATMLALHLHLPLTDLDGLIAGRLLGGGKRLEERLEGSTDLIGQARRILVLDDSTNRGGAIREARAKVDAVPALRGRVLWGAPYVTPGAAEGLLDVWFEKVPQPRAFEWNVLHHSGLSNACMEIDGVLCRRPAAREEDDAAAYAAYLRDVPARLVPATEVGWLVTSRSERHRAATEAWLEARGIRYRELVMAEETPDGARPTELALARAKADVYRRTKAWLFLESNPRQARSVADASGRPVYCTDTRRMLYPGVPEGASARRRDELVWRGQDELRRQRVRVSAWRRRLTRTVGPPSR